LNNSKLECKFNGFHPLKAKRAREVAVDIKKNSPSGEYPGKLCLPDIMKKMAAYFPDKRPFFYNDLTHIYEATVSAYANQYR
jgi:hypothetical protein